MCQKIITLTLNDYKISIFFLLNYGYKVVIVSIIFLFKVAAALEHEELLIYWKSQRVMINLLIAIRRLNMWWGYYDTYSYIFPLSLMIFNEMEKMILLGSGY